MNIEIRKAGFVNKGAELMLLSAIKKLKEREPGVNVAVAPHLVDAPYTQRAKLGLFQKASIYKFRREWGDIFKFIPKVIRRQYGIMLDSEVDVVLDAAGFAYTDQWGEGACRELCALTKRWRRQGTRVVLLPQAFGPFNSKKSRSLACKAIGNVDLVFARDQVSYDCLVGICGEMPKIRMAPDFTNIMEGASLHHSDDRSDQICIVPNYRMTQKNSEIECKAYLPFMVKVARYLHDNGGQPFLLVHEGANDYSLAEQIAELASCNIPIVRENDALRIKGLLGSCRGSIGSRFHGLVSALSAGVPTLGTGWSHKYEMLFKDYGFPEGLMGVLDWDSAKDKLDILLDDSSSSGLRQRLQERSISLKMETEKMWEVVYDLMDWNGNSTVVSTDE
jgi:colanic acid/amylovoran biosynthesis protein